MAVFFFQAEDGIRDKLVTGVRRVLFRSRSRSYQRLLRELLLAQRNALVRLRNEGTISDEALHRIERDLDLEETRRSEERRVGKEGRPRTTPDQSIKKSTMDDIRTCMQFV